MFEKYIFINTEKYQAEVGQSKKDGLWFCDKLKVSASTRKELRIELKAAMGDINETTNHYNRKAKKEKVLPSPPSTVKGLK